MDQVCWFSLSIEKIRVFIFLDDPDTSLQQFPLVYRTGIVEPYPPELSSNIVVTPPIDIIGIFHLGNNQNIHYDNDRSRQASTSSINDKKSKKKKKRTKSKTNDNEDLNVEDVNENEHSSAESKTKKPYKVFRKTPIENAFFN
jgi:hypothetical protein